MAHLAGQRWTLDELCARVPLAMAVDYAGQASGRIRDVPDRRTIRYYSTLGLLDRPAEMRGRTALYGPRHLRQLVAIKRLQTHGLSLAEIQTRLLGLSDQALAGLAQVPPEIERDAPVPEAKSSADAAERPGPSFWKAAPAELPETNRQEVRISLAPGVDLVLEALRPLDDYDLSALASAAAPLLKFLRARRLTGEPPALAGGGQKKAPSPEEETC